MKPLYSRNVNVQLMPYRKGEWMLAFFDIDQDFTMMYICTSEELLELDENIRDQVLKYVKEMDLDG